MCLLKKNFIVYFFLFSVNAETCLGQRCYQANDMSILENNTKTLFNVNVSRREKKRVAPIKVRRICTMTINPPACDVTSTTVIYTHLM